MPPIERYLTTFSPKLHRIMTVYGSRTSKRTYRLFINNSYASCSQLHRIQRPLRGVLHPLSFTLLSILHNLFQYIWALRISCITPYRYAYLIVRSERTARILFLKRTCIFWRTLFWRIRFVYTWNVPCHFSFSFWLLLHCTIKALWDPEIVSNNHNSWSQSIEQNVHVWYARILFSVRA